jgi:hypothetical protein
MSATAATGRMKRPIEKPVTKLNVIRNPARLQARNHHHPRPLGSPCRLHARAAATRTSNGQAKITSSLDVTPPEVGTFQPRPAPGPSLRVECEAEGVTRRLITGLARLILDRSLAERDSVVLEAGSHERSVRMKAADLVRLTGARVDDISRQDR